MIADGIAGLTGELLRNSFQYMQCINFIISQESLNFDTESDKEVMIDETEQ